MLSKIESGLQITAACMSGDSELVILGSRYGELVFLNILTERFETKKPLVVHKAMINQMEIISDGEELVTASDDRSIVITSIWDKFVIKVLKNVCKSYIVAMKVFLDEIKVAVGSLNGEMKVVCLEDGKTLYDFGNPHVRVAAIILTHDEMFLISGDAVTGTIKKWDAESYHPIEECETKQRINRLVEMNV